MIIQNNPLEFYKNEYLDYKFQDADVLNALTKKFFIHIGIDRDFLIKI